MCRPRNSENPLRISPLGKRPDAAPSAMPPRIAMPSALQAGRPAAPSIAFGDGGSAVSACRRFQDHKSPPTTLDQTPSTFQLARRFTENHFRGTPRRSAEVSPLFRSGNPLRWIPGPSQKSTLRRKTQLLPRRPRNGFLPQSRRRDMTAANRSAKRDPLPLPTRKPGRNAPASPPAFQMQRRRLRLRST